MLFSKHNGTFCGLISGRQVQRGIKESAAPGAPDAAIVKVRMRSPIDAPFSGESLGWESYFYATYTIVCPD